MLKNIYSFFGEIKSDEEKDLGGWHKNSFLNMKIFEELDKQTN